MERRYSVQNIPMLPSFYDCIRTHLEKSCVIVMTTFRTFSTGLLCLLAGAVFAQPPVTITVDTKAPGHIIPEDYLGVSYEMQGVLPDTNGVHLFRPGNKALIRTFKTLGIKNLRVGGNTADRLTIPVPVESDADSLFAFAKKADMDVIYTLRIHAGTPDKNAPKLSMEMAGSANTTNAFVAPSKDSEHMKRAVEMARHIETKYKDLLTGFAIGNEPDVFSTNYSDFKGSWIQFAEAITNAAPGAKFCGPASTPTRVVWSRMFANDFADTGLVALITQHDYPGGDARAVTNKMVGRARILSPLRLDQYQRFYEVFATTAVSNGLPFRLEEANSMYDGGAEDVSDTFASALWVLDFLHWWAAHQCAGINLHTGDKVAARDMNKRCRYALFWTSDKGYNVHPVGYGTKAFDVGGIGTSLPVATSGNYNTNAGTGVNLTAYAVRGEDGKYYVTVINKEFGDPPCDVDANIDLGLPVKRVEVMYLTAPDGNVAAKTGVTLGGAEIQDNAVWKGKWTKLKGSAGPVKVRVPGASAAVVRLTVK